ncbi:MAG: YggT family protein [Bacillota bacterium]
MGFLIRTVDVAFDVYTLLIFVRVLLSWVRHNPYQPVIRFVYDVTDPYLRFFRRFIPPVGMVDLSPIIALIMLQVLKGILVQVLILIAKISSF